MNSILKTMLTDDVERNIALDINPLYDELGSGGPSCHCAVLCVNKRL